MYLRFRLGVYTHTPRPRSSKTDFAPAEGGCAALVPNARSATQPRTDRGAAACITFRAEARSSCPSLWPQFGFILRKSSGSRGIEAVPLSATGNCIRKHTSTARTAGTSCPPLARAAPPMAARFLHLGSACNLQHCPQSSTPAPARRQAFQQRGSCSFLVRTHPRHCPGVQYHAQAVSEPARKPRSRGWAFWGSMKCSTPQSAARVSCWRPCSGQSASSLFAAALAGTHRPPPDPPKSLVAAPLQPVQM